VFGGVFGGVGGADASEPCISVTTRRFLIGILLLHSKHLHGLMRLLFCHPCMQ
jgi:hypothetical protein